MILYPQQKNFNNMSSCFNWFEPDDIEKGKGYGSIDQVWSAALYLRIHAKLNL